MFMKHESHGWNNVSSSEAEELKKQGWVEVSDSERAKIIAKKSGKQDNVIQLKDETEGIPAIPSGDEVPVFTRKVRKPRGE